MGWHENPKANNVALFSLPNVESVELADETFVRDPAFDLQAFAARSFGLFQGEEPFETVWRFAPEAAGDLEMARHHYAWGDKVEVLEPERLACMVHCQRVAWPALP